MDRLSSLDPSEGSPSLNRLCALRKWGCGGGYGTVTLNRAREPCSCICRQSFLPSSTGNGRRASSALQARNENNIFNRQGANMFRHVSKAVFQLCLALTIVAAAAVSAQAGGPMSFDVTRCATSASRGGNQVVDFTFYANNISRFDYITKLNWIEIEVTAQRINGNITKHKFIRNVNFVFNPTLPPQKGCSYVISSLCIQVNTHIQESLSA